MKYRHFTGHLDSTSLKYRSAMFIRMCLASGRLDTFWQRRGKGRVFIGNGIFWYFSWQSTHFICLFFFGWLVFYLQHFNCPKKTHYELKTTCQLCAWEWERKEGGGRGMEVVRKRKCRKLVEGKRGMEGWLAGYFWLIKSREGVRPPLRGPSILLNQSYDRQSELDPLRSINIMK